MEYFLLFDLMREDLSILLNLAVGTNRKYTTIITNKIIATLMHFLVLSLNFTTAL